MKTMKMMKILTGYRELDFEDGEINLDAIRNDAKEREWKAKTLFEQADEVISGNTEWVHLHTPEPCADSVIFGCVEPDRLLFIVEEWNADIKRKFIEAMADMFGGAQLPDAGSIEAPTDKTHDARLAINALDDYWTPAAEVAVFKENPMGGVAIKCWVSEEMLTDVRRHPERYVILKRTWFL